MTWSTKESSNVPLRPGTGIAVLFAWNDEIHNLVEGRHANSEHACPGDGRRRGGHVGRKGMAPFKTVD
jgi:hypothetical protein